MSNLGVFKDHHAIPFQKVEIMSNGLCGYSCIAYCITGDPNAYEDLIEESLNAFELNSNLFLQQTELGGE